MKLTWFVFACSSVSGLVTVTKIKPDGTSVSEVAQDCQELAPGVNMCNPLQVGHGDLQLLVQTTYQPPTCQKVQKKSFIRMHYVRISPSCVPSNRVACADHPPLTPSTLCPPDTFRLWQTIKVDSSSAAGTPGEIIASEKDFTKGTTIQIGVGKAIKALDLALVGACRGQKMKLQVPAELGFAESAQPAVPPGVSLEIEVEVSPPSGMREAPLTLLARAHGC